MIQHRYINKHTDKHFTIVFIMILCCIISSAHSSNSPVKSDNYPVKSSLSNDWRLTYQNSYDIIQAPLHSSIKEWIILASVLGATAISTQFDSKIRSLVKSHQTDDYDLLLKIGHTYGSPATVLSVGATCYAAGFGFKDPWLRETGREVLIAAVLAGLTTGILKATCGRRRPYLNDGPFSFKPFTLSNSKQSFPSGHTTDAFVLSTVLALRINKPAVSCLLYGLALLTATQRIYRDKHWFSDCVMAACIGTSSGFFIVHDSERIISSTDNKFSLSPFFIQNGYGLTLNIKL